MQQMREISPTGVSAAKARFGALGRYWKNIAALGALILAIWLPRVLALDRLVTPDEKRWLVRSANFYEALVQGEWGRTYQTSHPGVTIMWAGTAGFMGRFPNYAQERSRQPEERLIEIEPFLRAYGHEPLELLTASRFFMVLAITLVLAVAFWQAARLFGFWPALTGFLFIALDPFHVAHARLLHLDGMSSSLVLLALVALLNYLYRGSSRLDLAISGLAAGLAWLTKSPTLFLIPFVGLLLLLDLAVKWRVDRRLNIGLFWPAAKDLALWGMAGLVAFVLFWPAMWVDPLMTVWKIVRITAEYSVPHELPLYFDGAVTEADPGVHFYPVTLLWRSTPFMLAGLGMAIFAFAGRRARFLAPEQRRALAALLLFAALFTLFMSIFAKKFDRYLLPVYGPLDLTAGLGWMAAIHWWTAAVHGWTAGVHRFAGIDWRQRRWPVRLVKVIAPTALLMALAGQSGSVIAAYPYYLSYYNPLMGGAAAASKVMMVGWGEGLDQAARYLNNRPGPELPRVMTGVWKGTFSYFYAGEIRDSRFAPGPETVQDWLNSDYCVVYVNQWQRGQLPKELLDHLAGLTPALVVRLEGIDYVYVYDIRNLPPPGYMLAQPAEETAPGSSG